MAAPSVDLIRGVPFFAGLSDQDAAELASQFVQRDYRSGDVILIEGQEGHAFFIIESGEATVTHHGEDTGASLAAGSPFGELALFDHGARRSATIVARTDVRAWSLPSFLFRPFVEARPAVAWQLLEYMAVKLRSVPA